MLMLLLVQDTPPAEGADGAAELTMPTSPDEAITWFQNLFENHGDTIIDYSVKVIGVLVFIFIAWIIAGWAARLARKALGKAKVDLTLTKFISKAIKWAVLIFAVLGCLGYFGFSVTTFAAVIGAAGLAIGLAFQGALGNLAAGIMLLIFRPFKVGDVINVSGSVGKIDEIELFSTTMDTPDNRRLILPNGTIFGAVIENVTHHSLRRCDVAVGVEYSADIDRTREVLQSAVDSMEGLSTERDHQIYLVELGASSVDWAVRVWCRTEDYWGVREKLTRAVKVKLDEAGIGIPFPQMDVHLDQPASTD
jgi:small conductance mechanosensitive channel